MKPEKIDLVDTGSFASYWLQYKEPSALPDCSIIFKDLISRIHHFALGMYYWNVGCIPENRIVGAGGALQQLTGYAEDAWLGADPVFAFQHFLPEGIPAVMAYAMKFDQYLQQLTIPEREQAKASIYTRVKTPGNQMKWFCIQYPGFYYDENGRLVYILAVCSDISHIKTDNNPPFMSILDTRLEEQQVFLCHGPEDAVKRQDQFPPLSAREREIISLLASGKSSKQIGSQLFISKSTVDNHRQQLLKKLGASSTGEIVHLAINNGMV